MLKGIPRLIGPELLNTLHRMGHGDEIAVVDANYPAETCAQRLVRMDGVYATDLLSAIVEVMPLDSYVECPVNTMQVVGDVDEVPPIVQEIHEIIRQACSNDIGIGTIERHEFYARSQDAFAIVATGEWRLYGNVILTKGVIESSH